MNDLVSKPEVLGQHLLSINDLQLDALIEHLEVAEAFCEVERRSVR